MVTNGSRSREKPSQNRDALRPLRRGQFSRGDIALWQGSATIPTFSTEATLLSRPAWADTDREVIANDNGKLALRVIRQNVTLALATKIAFLVSAVLGAAPLWLAVLADTGATVAVTLNGLRLLRAKTPE